MQKDLFLSEREARIRELKQNLGELRHAQGQIERELYDLVKSNHSYLIGPQTKLWILPTGGAYFYDVEENALPKPAVQALCEVDMERLYEVVMLWKNRKIREEP